MSLHLRGIHLPHRKHTVGTDAVRMPAPKAVLLPMSMHIGSPAIPCVAVGDTVKVGTKIAEQAGFVSSPIYSSVSGRVTRISEVLLSSGNKGLAVVIESDGEMRTDESITPPAITSRQDLLDAIRESGIVGLGGAGFPTHVKFNVDPEKIQELVINGAECEPYITSDTHTMITRRKDMAFALEAMKTHFGIKHIVIGVEANNRCAINSMHELMLDVMQNCRVDVKVLPAVYPQGGEKVLVYHTTGKQIPLGKLPIDVGCVVCNCTTLASIGHYLKTGMPLVEKCVTVDGAAVNTPQNVIAPIGTSVSDLIDFCGGLKESPEKVLYGGPMMGITVPDLSAPVLKNTNAILVLSKKEAKLPQMTACIRCGSCTNTCPFGINPAGIAQAYRKMDFEALEKLNVNLCMECGCCSFVCPANRPLVQTNKLAKQALREGKAKEVKS